VATKRTIVLTCDQCGSEDLVQTQRITVNGKTADAEMCDKCWAKLLTAFGGFISAGREVPVGRIPRVVEFPGVSWKFTHHALERMGQRRLNPAQIVQVIEDPEVVRPGNRANLEIRQAYGIKAVVAPDRHSIVTVAHVDEDDEELASTG
jgi:hypothetical protein